VGEAIEWYLIRGENWGKWGSDVHRKFSRRVNQRGEEEKKRPMTGRWDNEMGPKCYFVI